MLMLTHKLLRTLKRYANKGWARLVPAAAVIPAAQVGLSFIGSKISVAGFVSFLSNCWAQPNSCKKYYKTRDWET